MLGISWMMSVQKIVLLYFRGTCMTNMASNASPYPSQPVSAAETRQIVLKEVRARWGKFSEHDLSALEGKADLIVGVAAKYSIDQAQAQRDVDALLKGRQF
jgi:hypothetical protein